VRSTVSPSEGTARPVVGRSTSRLARPATAIRVAAQFDPPGGGDFDSGTPVIQYQIPPITPANHGVTRSGVYSSHASRVASRKLSLKVTRRRLRMGRF